MSRRYDNNGLLPRKMPRYQNSFGGNNSSSGQYSDSNLFMDLSPPPPPPRRMNCGELREHHNGAFVELNGKVNRSRLGRFIELKDQYGVIQLVAPIENINVSKRFQNMPINCFITIVGQVRCRPNSLRNFSIPTGEVEVHVDSIVRVQKIFHDSESSGNVQGRRSYSTSAKASKNADKEPTEIVTAITSTECKHVNNDENLLPWFLNRTHTCDSLRLRDAGQKITLVGWTDRKKSRFLHLCDGYGSTQVLIENDELNLKINNVKSSDLLLIHGRVLARPQTHITYNNTTGEIELYAEVIEILDASIPYQEVLAQIQKATAVHGSSVTLGNVNDFTYRSHNCGELRETDIGKVVTLCGWLEFSRMKRFFTLRDAYGQIQVLIPDDLINEVNIKSVDFESILKVTGKVISRPENMQNSKMKTGNIEIELHTCDVLNEAVPSMPVQVRTFNRSNEALRMRHRYVDLRFEDMQQNLRIRSNVLMKMREYLINSAGFVEVETPTLFRRTPGGAQEFVVPTQKPGQFYSLVQSPQQFKQMLMAGAIDRYFQIARCYRDETTTVNRQPEFTQLDIELSFTQPKSIMCLIENVLSHCWPQHLPKMVTPFKQMTYQYAMETYGCDKPDTRSTEFLLKNVTNVLENSEEYASMDANNFGAFAIILEKSIATSLETVYEKHLRQNESENKQIRYMCLKNNENCESIEAILMDELKLQPDDVAIVACGNKLNVQVALGKIRTELVEARNKMNEDIYEFVWIVDFPLFLRNDETQQFETVHHPFTAPHSDDMHLLQSTETTPLEQCRSQAYDLVLNGNEIGGGSIRIHDANLQRKIMDILNIETNHLKHLIEALESGCPPHGGIAIGIDRLISIMCKANSIRDVIAFPKSADGKDLLSNAPCQISDAELQLYHLNIRE